LRGGEEAAHKGQQAHAKDSCEVHDKFSVLKIPAGQGRPEQIVTCDPAPPLSRREATTDHRERHLNRNRHVLPKAHAPPKPLISTVIPLRLTL
jgi:hypothetical protein